MKILMICEQKELRDEVSEKKTFSKKKKQTPN